MPGITAVRSFAMEQYYKDIRDGLIHMCNIIIVDSGNGMFHINKHAEAFFRDFLNELFGWKLINSSASNYNEPGFDLCDDEKRIIVQVSSDFDHGKIHESMKKSKKGSAAEPYHFYFAAITEKAKKYKKPFQAPSGLVFDADTDILDVTKLMNLAENRNDGRTSIERMKRLSELVKEYFPAGDHSRRQLTRLPGRVDSTQIIAREGEIGELKKKMQETNSILLLSGFGGIGKTALAKLLLYEVEHRFDDVAWVPYNGNLRQSLLASIDIPDLPNDEPSRWAAIQSLRNDGRKKLIIIDNADADSEQNPDADVDLRAITGWQNTTVIVTSRLEKISGYTGFPVGFLSEDNCFRLFCEYYGRERTPEEDSIIREMVVNVACCHTFTVEILAKSAKYETNLIGYYEKLKAEGLTAPKLKVKTDHDAQKDTIPALLKKLFDMRKRSEEENVLLWNFAVLPVEASLDAEELEQWFGTDINTAADLAESGWLASEQGRFSMHPLVRQIIRLDCAPEGTAEPLLDCVERHKFFVDGEIYTEIERKLRMIESVLEAVDMQVKPEQLANIRTIMGQAHYALGQYPSALEFYQKALAIVEKVHGKEHPDTATTYNNLGAVYHGMGDYPRALEFYEKALRIREKVLGKVHPDTATTYNNLGVVYHGMGDYPRALEFYEKALRIREKVLGKVDPDTAATYNNLASVYRDMGNYPRALEYYEKALAIDEKVHGTEHPDTAATYNNLASVYHGMGDYPRALEFYEKALRIREKVLGKVHPDTATTYNNLGAVYHGLGDYPRALEFYEKALRIREKVLGKEHPSTATIYNNLASVYRDMGDYPRALEYYEKALAIVEKVHGKVHPDTATTYNNLGAVYHGMGDYPRALEFYEKALRIREKVLGKEHPYTATTYHNIGTVYHAQDDYKNAQALFLRAYRVFHDRLGQAHPKTKDTYLWLRDCYVRNTGSPAGFED